MLNESFTLKEALSGCKSLAYKISNEFLLNAMFSLQSHRCDSNCKTRYHIR